MRKLKATWSIEKMVGLQPMTEPAGMAFLLAKAIDEEIMSASEPRYALQNCTERWKLPAKRLQRLLHREKSAGTGR